jgi:membrane-associated HD superfamily phosphohydrolase
MMKIARNRFPRAFCENKTRINGTKVDIKPKSSIKIIRRHDVVSLGQT